MIYVQVKRNLNVGVFWNQLNGCFSFSGLLDKQTYSFAGHIGEVVKTVLTDESFLLFRFIHTVARKGKFLIKRSKTAAFAFYKNQSLSAPIIVRLCLNPCTSIFRSYHKWAASEEKESAAGFRPRLLTGAGKEVNGLDEKKICISEDARWWKATFACLDKIAALAREVPFTKENAETIKILAETAKNLEQVGQTEESPDQ